MTKQFGLRSFVADEIRSKYKSICTSSMFYVPSREHMELHHFRAQIPNSSFTCRSSIFFFCFFSSPNEQKMYCRMLQYILHTAFRHSFEHIVGRNGSGSSTNSNSHIDAFSHFPLVSFSMIPYWLVVERILFFFLSSMCCQMPFCRSCCRTAAVGNGLKVRVDVDCPLTALALDSGVYAFMMMDCGNVCLTCVRHGQALHKTISIL